MYGGASYYLNGRECRKKDVMGEYTGRNNEWIEKEGTNLPRLPHFKEGSMMLDIHFNPNCNKGRMRMKIVGYRGIHDSQEVVINGLNNCPEFDKKDGWCPHFVFDDEHNTEQSLMIASIPPSWYGLEKDINWN